MVISAAGLTNNGCRFECSLVRFEDKAVQTVVWNMVCECMEECAQQYNYFKSIMVIDQSKTTKFHSFNTLSKLSKQYLLADYFPNK